MKEYRVMICGSRTFSDYKLLHEKVYEALVERRNIISNSNIIIVSGDANGADKLGERFAKEYDFKVEHYPAKWNDLEAKPCKIKYNRYGNPYNCLAGMNRNTDMINVSDLVIMFHDGKSHGTADDLKKCKDMNKDYVYIKF